MSKWQYPFPEKHLREHFGTLSPARKKLGLGPHRGTDWSNGLKPGALISAVTDGTVKLIQYSKVLGWVVVQTGWANGKTLYVGYCHLFCSTHGATCKGPAIGCETPLKDTKVGDKVKAGQKYLRLGNTGSASSGPHLHATLSNTLKGVFSGTVYDLHAFITKQLAAEKAAVKPSDTPTARKKTAKTKTPDKCPTCGKVL